MKSAGWVSYIQDTIHYESDNFEPDYLISNVENNFVIFHNLYLIVLRHVEFCQILIRKGYFLLLCRRKSYN